MSQERRTPIRDAMRRGAEATDDIHAHALGISLQDPERRLNSELSALRMQFRDLRQQHEQLSTWFMASLILNGVLVLVLAWWWIQ